MFDVQLSADRVARWASVFDLPKPLQTAIDRLELVEQVESPGAFVDVTKVTAKTAESVVAQYAADLATEAHFHDARKRLADAAAREVLQVAGTLVDDMRAALLPRWDSAVKTFTEAVQAIGSTDLSAAALIQAGAGAVEQYHHAVAAQQELAVLEGWAASLVELPRFVGHGADPVCRVTAPTTRAQLQALENARGRNAELNSLYTAALELGVPLVLNTPEEAGAIRYAIESQPVVRKQPKFLVFN